MRIADLAELVGVSPAAVSLVVNNKAEGMLQSQTIERIRRIVEEKGYRPNRLAKGLASGRTLAVAFCFWQHPQALSLVWGHRLYQILGALIEEAGRLDYILSPVLLGGKGAPEMGKVHKSFDGAVIYEPPSVDAARAAAATFAGPGLPSVVVSRNPLPRLTVGRVASDYSQGTRDAVRHLVELGHRRIAFVGHAETFETNPKLRGIRAALEEHGISWRSEWFILAKERNPYRAGYEAADVLASLSPRPSAAICVDDVPAYGLIFRLESLGLRVPGAVSVIGYGNDELSAMMVPALTSVDVNPVQMGRAAASLVLEGVTGGHMRWRQRVLVGQSLLVRETTGPAPTEKPLSH